MKENDSFAEPRFPVRSYGKGGGRNLNCVS